MRSLVIYVKIPDKKGENKGNSLQSYAISPALAPWIVVYYIEPYRISVGARNNSNIKTLKWDVLDKVRFVISFINTEVPQTTKTDFLIVINNVSHFYTKTFSRLQILPSSSELDGMPWHEIAYRRIVLAKLNNSSCSFLSAIWHIGSIQFSLSGWRARNKETYSSLWQL